MESLNAKTWRAILLGKLLLGIVASLIVGGICVSLPWRQPGLAMGEQLRWIGAGAFFLLLGAALILTIWILFRRR